MTDTIRREEIVEGLELPGFSFPITFETAVLAPLASWDFFPGHSDPDYAREQGQKTIYLNTVVLQGFADRVAIEWAGPAAFIARRFMTMKNSAYPGDTLSGGGVVKRVYEDKGNLKVDLSIWLRTEAASICDVETTLILGLSSGSSSGDFAVGVDRLA